VFQHPYPFHGTIEDNVFAGHPGADDEQFAQAVALARVDEFTGRLTDGVETVVGEAVLSIAASSATTTSIGRPGGTAPTRPRTEAASNT